MATHYNPLFLGESASTPAVSASRIQKINSSAQNGLYWLKPYGYVGSAEQVYIDFDGSVSGINAPGPWMRIRYSQDYYSRAAPWSGTGNSSTNPGAYSGDFAFEQPYGFIEKFLNYAIEIRQRFESWGFGSVGWTYSNGMYMGVKAFDGTNYNGATGSNIVKTNKPSGISHGVTDFNTFNNPTAQGTDPTDANDGVWRVGVFYFRNTRPNLGILPIQGIYNGDVDGTSERRYFPFRTGESSPGNNSDIWIKV